MPAEPPGGEPQQHDLELTAVQLGHDYNLMRTAWIDNTDDTENGTNLTEVHWWYHKIAVYVLAGNNLEMMTQMGRIENQALETPSWKQGSHGQPWAAMGEQQPLAGPFMNRLWTSWPYSSNL